MKWIYNGIKYKTKKIDWEEYIKEPHDFLFTDIMVYSTKWDRCYYIRRLVYDKRRIRAQLCSIYNTDCKWIWSDTNIWQWLLKINNENIMKYKEIKRLTELVSEYRWEEENGLMIWIDYADCKEFFLGILRVRFEHYINCVATDDSMCISHFDDVLDNYTNENPEDIFPKKED